MAEGKRSWRLNWQRWKRRGKTVLIVAAVIGLPAVLAWWYRPGSTEASSRYEVYSMTNSAGEDRDVTAAEIQDFLNQNFPSDQYEYLGIIAQRQPTARSPSTTTYVLFKRK